MAEHKEAEQSLMGKISEKIHDHDSSSSSSSDSDSEKPAPVKTESQKEEKVFRLFGREKPVHHVLGGGKPADVLLWRNKKISFGVLGATTLVYIIFECVQYHLLTLICHVLVAVLAGLFIYSNAHTLIHKTPPNFPEVCLPEEPFLMVASELRHHINWVFAVIHNFASGRDLKKFLMVVAGLWVLSIIASWCNFLTLFYICFLALQIIPALYEKFEHRIDPLAEKATIEMKKQYGVFDEKVLTKARETLLKNKRS